MKRFKWLFNRNVLWLVIICLLLLCLWALYHSSKKEVSVAKQVTQEKEEKEKNLLLELELLKKRIEWELRAQDLEKLLKQVTLQKFIKKEAKKANLLSEEVLPKMLALEIKPEEDEETIALDHFMVFLENSQPVTLNVNDEKEKVYLPSVPLGNPFFNKERPASLVVSGGEKGARPYLVREIPPEWGDAPIGGGSAVYSNWFSELIIESIKTVLDIVSFIIMYKEIFIILGVVLLLLVAMVTFYSMHMW